MTPRSQRLWQWGRVLALTLVLGLMPMGIGQAGPSIYDDFDDNLIDPSRWTPVAWGLGGTARETNNHLESSLPAWSTSGGTGGFGAGYTSVCPLTGAFDIQVDYSLLAWPYSNGVRAKLSLHSSSLGPAAPLQVSGEIERTSFGVGSDFPGEPREVYVSNFGDIHRITSTSDTSGALRLVRSGTVLTGYFLRDEEWVELHSRANFTLKDLYFSLYLGSNDDAFASEDVVGSFDNIVINSGKVRPITSINCKQIGR